MGKLDGKVAIITGAARGQGAEAARLFAAEGARVVVADVMEEPARALAGALGPEHLACRLDVSKIEDWRAAVDLATARLGRIDVLVNNAGIFRTGSIEETSLEDYMTIFQVNELGCWLGMKHVIPAMRAAGGGAIVNISSIGGITPGPNISAYAASKGAVRMLSKVAAGELGAHGIRVNSVYPGGINTEMSVLFGLPDAQRNKPYGHLPIPRQGEAVEIARMVLFLACDDSSYCTGAEFVVDGGALANYRVPSREK